MSETNPPPVPLIVGVTGHRNLVESEVPALRARVRAFFESLQQQFPGLPLMLLSGLAEGSDQITAEEALACGAQLVAVLPLPTLTYKNDFVQAGSRQRFDELCAKAQVLQLPIPSGINAAAISQQGLDRDAQYAEAGVFIASHCHVLLTIWDGRDSDLYGGTAQIVRYHLDGLLPGSIERRRSTRPLLDRSDESLVYHIACSRLEPNSEILPPLERLQPLQTRWLDESGAESDKLHLPDGMQLMFRRMMEFNDDAKRYEDEVIVSREYPADAPPGDVGMALDRLFAYADWLAIHFQRRVLLTMRGIHVLAALMGIAFVCYSDLPGNPINRALDIFIVLFIAGVILDRVAERRAWHRKYIDYRALAEGLRVQRYWRQAGVSAAGSVAFAHDNFMQKQDVELGWIRNVMRAAGLYIPDAEDSKPAGLAAVIHEWIGISDDDGQLGYYTRRTEQRTRVHRTTQMLGRACLWTGMGIGICLAFFYRWLDADVTTSLVTVIGCLAIIAAARESYAFRKADKELIKQYRYMRNLFASARGALNDDPDPADQREILRTLGEAALAEHAEWALMHRERPLEHGKL